MWTEAKKARRLAKKLRKAQRKADPNYVAPPPTWLKPRPEIDPNHPNFTRKSKTWIKLSRSIRANYGRCLWCEKTPSGQFDLHHILCRKYNPTLVFDKRILMPVCQPCHKLLEPYSSYHADQMLPQLFE